MISKDSWNLGVIIVVKKLYIAGPMSGIPEFNFPAFYEAEEFWTECGYEVFNPAKKEEEQKIKDNDPASFATGTPGKGTPFRELYKWDLDRVLESTAIYMLKGWQYSPGACGEHAVAVALKRHDPEYEIIYGE